MFIINLIFHFTRQISIRIKILMSTNFNSSGLAQRIVLLEVELVLNLLADSSPVLDFVVMGVFLTLMVEDLVTRLD